MVFDKSGGSELNTGWHCMLVGTEANVILVILGGVWQAGRASRQLLSVIQIRKGKDISFSIFC